LSGAPRAAESAVVGGLLVTSMVADKATATATAALATYDKAAEVIAKTEGVLEKVARLAAAPGTAGEGAAAAGKAAELGSKIAGQVAIGAEAAGAAEKALAVAGMAGKVAGVLKPLAPVGAVLEAGKLATDFSGETGRVEASAEKGMGPAMMEGFFAPLTTIATALKMAAEVLALQAENRRPEAAGRVPSPGEPVTAGGTPGEGTRPTTPPVAAELNGFAAASQAGAREVSAASRAAAKSAAEMNASAVSAFETLAEMHDRMATQMARMEADFQRRNSYGEP